MQLMLNYAKDLNKCGFFLAVCDLEDEACLHVSYTVKSGFFSKKAKHLFTSAESDWGFRSLDRSKAQMGKSFNIDIWVKIHE